MRRQNNRPDQAVLLDQPTLRYIGIETRQPVVQSRRDLHFNPGCSGRVAQVSMFSIEPLTLGAPGLAFETWETDHIHPPREGRTL